MSEKTLLSEQDVLNKIGASDFRSVKKDQLIQFVSSLPEMDKEVAMKCIEQFPEFKQSATDMVNQLSEVCNSLLEDNKDSRNRAIQSYQVILEELHCCLEDGKNLSHKKKQEIIDKMIDVADKIDQINDKNMKHQNGLFRTIALVATTALAIGGTILGINISKKN